MYPPPSDEDELDEEAIRLEPGSPSKVLSRRQKTSLAPSSKASAAARDVLMKFARTNTPAALARALPSYAQDPNLLPTQRFETQDSYIAREALRITRTRCCWEIIREGFVRRDGIAASSSPRKKRSRRTARSKDADEDGQAGDDSEPPASVSEHAWGVLGWILTLFERDEADVERTGQGGCPALDSPSSPLTVANSALFASAARADLAVP